MSPAGLQALRVATGAPLGHFASPQSSVSARPGVPPVVHVARGLVGCPWRHQGRDPQSGLDCAGVIIATGRAVGACPQDWDHNGYTGYPNGEMLRLCDEMMNRESSIALGRVLVLSMSNAAQHMGIVADYRHGGFSIIHASSKFGRVVESRLMFARNLALRAVYSFKGVNA